VAKTDVEQWLHDAALGDRDALGRLVAIVRPAVYRYCRARLWDTETAEDVTQEVLIAVFQALPRQDPPVRELEAFAIAVASRQVATAHRRRAARPEHEHDEVPDVVDTAPGPDVVIALNDDVRALNILLEQLTPIQREVVLLRVVNGLSAEDTGTVLGMTPGNVRVMQHRALTRLRALVQQEVAV
jgi:RNA polymerase sigma-70 factor (ECF subfamily)